MEPLTLALSFHGGTGAGALNNLYAFGPGGPATPILAGPPVEGQTTTPTLRELRAFVVGADGRLYVANAAKDESRILRYTRSAGAGEGAGAEQSAWTFDRVFATAELAHPFDLSFGPDGTLFVSNQDSNRVTTYGPDGAPAALHIAGFARIRGLAHAGAHLWVADSGRDRVLRYDASGRRVDALPIPRPVHVWYDGSRWVWVGSESENEVYVIDASGTPGRTGTAVRVIHGPKAGIDHTAGLCLLPGPLEAEATLLVASRKGRRVLGFPLVVRDGVPSWTPAPPMVVLDRDVLTDDPEFVARWS